MTHNKLRDQEPIETTISEMVAAMGPMTVDESPFKYSGVETDKHKYVHTHKPASSQGTSENSMRVGNSHTGIVYHDKHDPRDVVELWLDENEQILNRSSVWAVYVCVSRQTPQGETNELQEALKEVLRERDPEGWESAKRGGKQPHAND